MDGVAKRIGMSVTKQLRLASYSVVKAKLVKFRLGIYLETLIVHSDFRRQGAGALFLKKLIRYSKRRGIPLFTTPYPIFEHSPSKGALERFYAKAGFVNVNRIPKHLNPTGADMIFWPDFVVLPHRRSRAPRNRSAIRLAA